MPESSPLIAHILNGLQFGGNENLCLQLIKNSPPHVRHVLINIKPSRVEMKGMFMTCPGLTFIDRPYAREARVPFILGMARDLKRLGVGGMIVYPFGLHVFVGISGRAIGVKRMVVHAGNPPPMDPKRRRLWKRIVIATRVLQIPIKSCSEMVDRELRVLAGPLPDGSEALLNGVDVGAVESLAAEERAKKAQGAPRVVGMVARFNSIKDHDTLLKAFALVHKRIENSELWLIGGGERRQALVELTEKLQIVDSVRFLGERSDVHRLLGGMDVFAFSTTRDEGFGIALAEAMASRTPIVATDVEACRELLMQGDAGRLVPPKNVERMAAVILELLTRPEIAALLANEAYARVKRDLNLQECAQRYYASVIPGPYPPNTLSNHSVI